MKCIRGKKKRWLLFAIPIFLLFFYCLQTVWAHRKKEFVPDYLPIELKEESDYETFFLQTGLGVAAVDELLAQNNFEKIREIQTAFFSEDQVECVPVFGWFTMSDRIDKGESASMVDLRAGDIILSLATHSVGWRHGHVGLVLDEERILECTTIGKDSAIVKKSQWQTYSSYAILRVKNASADTCEKVVKYATENLCGIPYHLSAGIIGEKAPECDNSAFGMQCAYLVWYAWQHFGYDLDSDGGKLVTANDILRSERLEVVQIYGMDPREFD